MRPCSTFLVLCLTSQLIADDPKVHRGLPYAGTKNERQTLDVYAPAAGKNLPVVVWIHGGGWQRGDKSEVHKKPQAFADKIAPWVDDGAQVLGGCCGIGPAHIAALRQALA